MMANPLTIKSQENPWIFGIHTHAFNVTTQNVLEIAKAFVNMSISNLTDGPFRFDVVPLNVHYFSMKDNGEKIDYVGDKPYGFTSYDLFNDLELGLKFGWQGPESPVGAYVYGAYSINQYKLRFLGEREYNKHKIQSFKIGLGVRISPLQYILEEYGWCPIIELGTTYVNNFKYKGPNGSDKDQINNGIRTSYAAGVKFGEDGQHSILVSFDMAHYNLFNKNYTPDKGFWYPYANFKNKDYYFSIKYSFMLDE